MYWKYQWGKSNVCWHISQEISGKKLYLFFSNSTYAPYAIWVEYVRSFVESVSKNRAQLVWRSTYMQLTVHNYNFSDTKKSRKWKPVNLSLISDGSVFKDSEKSFNVLATVWLIFLLPRVVDFNVFIEDGTFLTILNFSFSSCSCSVSVPPSLSLFRLKLAITKKNKSFTNYTLPAH